MASTDLLDPANGWTRSIDDTFVASLGDVFVRPWEGGIQVAVQTGDAQKNLGGAIHGGVIMTLLDRAMALNIRGDAKPRAPTSAMTINFLRPLRIGDVIVASSTVRKAGRTVIYADAQAHVGDRLVATSSATFVRVPDQADG